MYVNQSASSSQLESQQPAESLQRYQGSIFSNQSFESDLSNENGSHKLLFKKLYSFHSNQLYVLRVYTTSQ